PDRLDSILLHHQTVPAYSNPIQDWTGDAMAEVFLRIKSVVNKTGLSRSKIYEEMKSANEEDRFPAPVPISAGLVAWREREVEAWQARKIGQRDAKGRRKRAA